MRMAYSAVAHFLVQWTDCRLASALGLLKIMIFKVLFFYLMVIFRHLAAPLRIRRCLFVRHG
jgi:hypothetical protein